MVNYFVKNFEIILVTNYFYKLLFKIDFNFPSL